MSRRIRRFVPSDVAILEKRDVPSTLGADAPTYPIGNSPVSLPFPKPTQVGDFNPGDPTLC